MNEAIAGTYHRLIDELEVPTYRYLYDSFDLSARLVGLIGPRGVGKTTLLLQYTKNRVERVEDAFYFSADHIFFNKVSLFDPGCGGARFLQQGGGRFQGGGCGVRARREEQEGQAGSAGRAKGVRGQG